MPALNVTVPDSSLSVLRRSPTEFVRDLKLAAATHWYSQGAMSQERAAELAGLNRRDFIRALTRENLNVVVVDDESLARELGLAEYSQ